MKKKKRRKKKKEKDRRGSNWSPSMLGAFGHCIA